LHTDEAHPHVHLVLKAVNEEGVRLNIKKSTLRHWRSEFARNLRVLGVEANATERAVRGETMKAKRDGIYRASLRGDSTYSRGRDETVAAEVLSRNKRIEPGKRKLAVTRSAVDAGWRSVAILLANSGHHDLASDIQLFAQQMPMDRTELEFSAHGLVLGTNPRRPDDANLSK
jgi:hypothetical protein